MPRLQNFAGSRYSGWSNWKVWHDLVKAHPSGDCIFWLVCFVLCFRTLLLTMILQQHLKTGDVERVLANFAKSGSTFLLTTNFPTAKVRRQCVCDLNQTHKKTEMIRKICSFSSHLISVDCLFLQKNTDLSEDTQYRYRPVNLLLEPYFLPQPVRSWWWWTMMT